MMEMVKNDLAYRGVSRNFSRGVFSLKNPSKLKKISQKGVFLTMKPPEYAPVSTISQLSTKNFF